MISVDEVQMITKFEQVEREIKRELVRKTKEIDNTSNFKSVRKERRRGGCRVDR